MNVRKTVFGFAALFVVSSLQPAFAVPPQSGYDRLYQDKQAMDRLNPILGDWVFVEKYTGLYGEKVVNNVELKAVRIDCIVNISVMNNGSLREFYTIEYDPVRKVYRIFMSGADYMGDDPAYDAVNLNVTSGGISWSRPSAVNGKEEPSQASTYSLVLSGKQLVETEDLPILPLPDRSKTIYSFNRR